MKNKRLITIVETILLLVLATGIFNSVTIMNTQALGEFPVLLANASFQDYYTSSSLMYWSGTGYRSYDSVLDDTKSFHAEGTVGSTYYLTQTLSSSKVSQINDEKITFSFWFKGEKEFNPSTGLNEFKELARAEIYYKYINLRTYVEYSRTISGAWVTPTDTNWQQAQVSTDLPSTTTYVQVRIVGKDLYSGHAFDVFVDLACMTVNCGSYTTAGTYGSMNYAYDLFSVSYVGGDYSHIAPGVAALTVIPNAGYYVMETKITISLEPLLFHDGLWPLIPWDPDYYYTTQPSQLHITSYAQGNNLGYKSDPAALEERMNEGIRMVGAGIDAILGVAAAAHPVATAAVAVCDIMNINGESLLQFFINTDYYDNDALGNTDYSVHENWILKDITTYPNSDFTDDFISRASGIVNFDWRIKANEGTSFKVKITYEAKIGSPKLTYYSGLGYFYVLNLKETLTNYIYKIVNI